MLPDNLTQAAQELVAALRSTYWSSWQSTAKFDQELNRLEELLKRLDN